MAGSIQQVAPNASGEAKYNFGNSRGFLGFVKIEAGLTPKMMIGSAGYGFQIVAADGVTVILNVPETGFVPSGTFVQLTPQASAPAGITEGGIWYSSSDHAYHGVDDTGDVVFVTQ